jgi:hypothetical protein
MLRNLAASVDVMWMRFGSAEGAVIHGGRVRSQRAKGFHMSTALIIKDVDGQNTLCWSRPIPQPDAWECREERTGFFGTDVVCAWRKQPPVYTEDCQLLPDGDGIRVRTFPGTPGEIQLQLAIADESGITWWKGMEISGQPYRYTEVYGDGGGVTPAPPPWAPPPPPGPRRVSAVLTLPIGEVAGKFGLISLGKAKFFGWHAWPYFIRFDQLERFEGQRLQFLWRWD